MEAGNGVLLVRRLKNQVHADACEPGKDSKPVIGWSLALHLPRHHEV